MLPNQLIILGGGASVRYLGAIDGGLFAFLSNKFCIGINYSHKWVNTTCNLGVDETLYARNGDHEEIAKLPLWIGKEHWNLGYREANSIFLKDTVEYDRTLTKGVYKCSLSGIFALSLAINLLDYAEGNTEIYLLGYDNGPAIHCENGEIVTDSKNRPLTHWYQDEFEHRGTGKINWYCQTTLDYESKKRITKAEEEYRVFKNESKVKIYNVGGTSVIPTFPHISYEQFFTKKLTNVHNQDELRGSLWSILTTIRQIQSIG